MEPFLNFPAFHPAPLPPVKLLNSNWMGLPIIALTIAIVYDRIDVPKRIGRIRKTNNTTIYPIRIGIFSVILSSLIQNFLIQNVLIQNL